MSLPPAGWYLDPERTGHQRYWDGRQWTDHRSPMAPAVQAPAGAATYGHRPAHPTASAGSRMVPAGWWARFGASLIDGLLVLAAAVVLGLALGAVLAAAGLFDDDTFAGIGVLFDLAGYVIPPLVWGKLIADKGWSPGKRALGLVVVDASSPSPIRLSYGRAVGREFGKILSTIPFFLGYLWAAWDPRRQAWHDKMAAARVLKADTRPLAAPGGATAAAPPTGPRPATAGIVAGWSSADLPTRPTNDPVATPAPQPPSRWQGFGA